MKMILFEIQATWANKGREGKTSSVVLAPDAITALQKFWEVEDAVDLRDITIRWLTPEDCVMNRRIEDDSA